jgi:hypothetical protein
LRVGAERRVEPLGQKGRAHIDFARDGSQSQIVFEPQVLKRQCENAENRDCCADDDGRRDQPRADRKADRTVMRATDHPRRPTSPRFSEAKPDLSIQCSN